MGCHESKSEEQKDADKKNRKIEHDIKKSKAEASKEIKLLLLGTGESGKSTIAKQMKILHTEGFSKEDLLSYKPVVFHNTVSSMRTLITAATDQFKMSLQPENEEAAKRIMSISLADLNSLSSQMVKDISTLWGDSTILKAYERNNEYQLIDGAAYCFENIDRFAKDDFTPTVADVLRVRAKTAGIIETLFGVGDTKFKMIDVGGQRTERKKWIHCFEDVTAIIYCVALNEYDMKLYEDETVNRMQESLELFEEICNSKWFNNTAIIIFFNKMDLFKKKISKVDIKCLFPDYQGGLDSEKALEYIKGAFLFKNKNPRKNLFVHYTCATDTENVRVVFEASREVIIRQNLERLGFGTF